MNRIFKKVWSKVRGCYVAVSEATGCSQSHGSGRSVICVVGGTLLVAPLSSMALGIHITQGDETYGVLTGYDDLHFTDEAKSITIDAIDSPNAYLSVWGIKLNPDDPGYIAKTIPSLFVKGNANLKSAYIQADKAIFNGNVTISNKVSNDDVDNLKSTEHIQPDGTIAHALDFSKFLKEGGIFHASTLSTNGGVQIKGNLTASLINVSGGMDYIGAPLPYYSYLNVSGNVTTDNIIIDTNEFYDDMNDRMSVAGTTTVSHNVRNNGFIDMKRLIISGKLMNGTGTYTGSSGADAMEKTGATIAELDVPVIENGSKLSVGSFLRTENVLLTQTYGTVISQTNWLQNSTINLQGGSLDTSKFGTLKNLGLGNTYLVSGGVLKTNTFEGNSHITLTGGELQTSTEGAFTGLDPVKVSINTIGLNNQVPEAMKSTLTELFTKYVPGSLATDFVNTVTLQGGKVVVHADNLTTTQRDDLTKAFKERFFQIKGIA